jgi:hypothetical protein
MFLAGLLLAFALPAEAAVPKPRPRPAAEAAPPQRSTSAIPIPRLRPARPEAETPEAAPPPPDPKEEPERAQGKDGWSAAEIAAAKSACRELEGLDISYEPVDPIGASGSCGAAAPVRVTRVAGVALVPEATLTCPMAAALHGWVSTSVKPAAERRLKTDITEIRTATSYACRRRNNASSGKMSEHSKANALDMAGFSFATQKAGVTVGGGNWGEGLLSALGLSKEGSFMDDIRKDACRYFTTVLGPGSDPYHGDHFHVDVMQRKGDYRICQ